MSQRRVRIAGLGLAWICALAAVLHAERAPLPPDRLVEESDLVFTGQILAHSVGTERSHVESGFGNYDWAIDLTLRIQSVEKGRFDESDTIVVRCFRIKTRKSLTGRFSASGNHPIPDVGAEVRAYLYRQGDLWRVVFPNGLAPVPDQKPLAEAAEIRALNSRAYTYWLPVEGWTCIAVVGTAALLGLRLVRRLRRPHPAEFLTGLMVAALLAAEVLRAEDWPTLGRDKTRNAVSPEKGAPLEWDAGSGRNIKWRAPLGYIAWADPVVAAGLVWVGTNTNSPSTPGAHGDATVLKCFREADGQPVWQFVVKPANGLPRGDYLGFHSSPLIEGGRAWLSTRYPSSNPAGHQFPASSKTIQAMNIKYPRITITRYACSLAVLLAVSGLRAGDWLQWRGQDRANASGETGLLKQWPAGGPPLIWRATGIGAGIHPVSVAAGRVFTVGNREGGEFVFALDAQSGTKLWATRVDSSIEENALMRWLTQRSPTVDGDRLYTLTANGELVCLRASDGARIWQRSYSKDFGAKRPQWGFCDHPLVDGDRLICSPFTADAAIATLNKHTGEIIWKTPGEEQIRAGYAALIRSTACGVPQFIHFHGSGLTGFAADDGRMLWRFARAGTRVASTYTPIGQGDFVLSPNGYGGGLALFKVVRGAGGFTAEQIDHHEMNLDPFQDCTAAVDGRLYLLRGSKPVCVDAKTGIRIWGDVEAARGARAAMTWADGHLYIGHAGGEVTLTEVLPGGTEEKGRFPIPDHEQSLGVTSPVVANGRLWLRDNNRLFCYDVSAVAPAAGRPPPNHLAIGLTDQELGLDPSAPRVPRTGVDRAPDAVFVPTPLDIVERMLQEAGVKKSDVMVDLGSGDGRYVIAAAKKFGCKAIGYEIDERLVQQSRETLAKENLGTLARIEHKDIFTLDLSGADVVTVFLYPRLMERLIPQFEKLKPGSRIISHQFEMPGIMPDKTILVESKEDGDTHRIFLWTTPLKKNSAP